MAPHPGVCIAMTQRLQTVAIALLFFATTAIAAPPAQPKSRAYRLQNDTTDRRLSIYSLERTVKRTVRYGERSEVLSYTAKSEWTRLQLRDSDRRTGKIAQMIVDEPPAKIRLTRDGQPVSDPPEPDSIALSAGSTRLATDDWTRTETTVLVPAAEPMEQAALSAMLDFARWPEEPKRVGDHWDNSVSTPFFEGTQNFELADVLRVGDRTILRIRMNVDGALRGRAAKNAEFAAAEVFIRWGYGRHTLDGLSGTARYRRNTGDAVEEYELALSVRQTRNDVLSVDAANLLIDQINAVGDLITDKNAGKFAAARDGCAAFLKKWPDSLWRPAVDYLAREMNSKLNPAVADAEFRIRVVETLRKWRSANDGEKPDEIEAARAELKQLADGSRDRLLKLTTADGQNLRAASIFALAFGSNPDNARRIEAAMKDPSPRVRSWALYALTELRHAPADAGVFLVALNDDDPGVRARACAAAAECISPTSPQMPAIRDRVFQLLRDDMRDSTRRAAAIAMGIIGTADDIPRLRKGIKHETSRPIRERIERAIASIEARHGVRSAG